MRRVAKVGAVVRRDEDYGIVVAVSPTDLDAIEVEWDDATTEWITVREIQWVDSRE